VGDGEQERENEEDTGDGSHGVLILPS
jgi:hypothetical protein